MKPIDLMEALGDVPKEYIELCSNPQPEEGEPVQGEPVQQSAQPENGLQNDPPRWFTRSAAIAAVLVLLVTGVGGACFFMRLKRDSIQQITSAQHAETTAVQQTVPD